MTVCNACRYCGGTARCSRRWSAGSVRTRTTSTTSPTSATTAAVPLRVPVCAAARVRHRRPARLAEAREQTTGVMLARVPRARVRAQRLVVPSSAASLALVPGLAAMLVLIPPRYTPPTGPRGRLLRADPPRGDGGARSAPWRRFVADRLRDELRALLARLRGPSPWPNASAPALPATRRRTCCALTSTFAGQEGDDCTVSGADPARAPRRRFHHFTFYGFALCFASTSLAPVYHYVFGWRGAVSLLEPARAAGTPGRAGAASLGRSGCSWLQQRAATRMHARSQAGRARRGFIALLAARRASRGLAAPRDCATRAAMRALLVSTSGASSRCFAHFSLRQVRPRLVSVRGAGAIPRRAAPARARPFQ